VSSTEIINNVNTTLYNILRESLQPLGPDLNIIFGSPADEDGSADTTAKLSVFLYNIMEDPFSRNRPDELRGGNRLLSFKPPLAVNLYYMLTPFSGPSGSTDTNNVRIRVQAHNMIALAMRAFYNNAMVSPRYFPPDTTLGESHVRISSVQMNLEEITKIWSSFNKPFRLSVCYEVSIVRIQSEETPKEVSVVERAALSAGLNASENEFGLVPAIGKRNLSKLKDKGWDVVAMRSKDEIGGIIDVRPAVVQPGMALSIYGRNFEGKKLRLQIGEKVITNGREIEAEVDKEVDRAVNQGSEINATLLRTLLKTLLGRLLGTSFRVINENLIKVKISPNEVSGDKELSLALEEGATGGGGGGGDGAAAAVKKTFKVLPADPRLLTITEVRPDRGISGDLISVYGINFTEDVIVTIGNTPVEKVTFVDNAQINIMIPPNMTPATTTLDVRNDLGTDSKQFRIL
jgi:hypothetical protein